VAKSLEVGSSSQARVKHSVVPVSERALLSVAEAAGYLSISERKFQEIVASKDCVIKPRRVGKSVRYLVSEINLFIESLPIGRGRNPCSQEEVVCG
jgi:hypothetical protein